MSQPVTIDRLLNLAADRPDAVLQHLATNAELASAQDFSGYSLLHAAVSYGHADLVRELVSKYQVDVNIGDHDGDTPLSAAESVDIARILVEEFHASLSIRNSEGQTPEEKIEAEEDFPLVAAYLREAAVGAGPSTTQPITNGLHHPPPGIGDVRIGTTTEPMDDGFEPDPEFRRRIEELAARSDFQSESGQADLRNLVQDVVSGMRDERGSERATRPRTD